MRLRSPPGQHAAAQPLLPHHPMLPALPTAVLVVLSPACAPHAAIGAAQVPHRPSRHIHPLPSQSHRQRGGGSTEHAAGKHAGRACGSHAWPARGVGGVRGLLGAAGRVPGRHVCAHTPQPVLSLQWPHPARPSFASLHTLPGGTSTPGSYSSITLVKPIITLPTQEQYRKDMTLREAEVLALTTLKQVMEEKVGRVGGRGAEGVG